VLPLLVVAAVGYAAVCLALFLSRNRVVFPIRGGGLGMRDGEIVTVPVDGGDTLVAWLLPAHAPAPAPPPAPVLVWFHGNGETVAGLAPLLREFQPPGVALLAVDYRGYGASTGNPTVANSERDALVLWDWIAARPDLDAARVVVYGRSVGSGPAVALAAQRPVAGLIVESPFTSLGAMARRSFPIFPSFLAGRGFNNLARIGDVRAPVLIIHGDRDSLIPTQMGRLLYERMIEKRGTAELWLIPGADHNSTYDVGGDDYVRKVRGFVQSVPRYTMR
jgi:fermentation-respiration switch protein FrsA (DUF1100 family)